MTTADWLILAGGAALVASLAVIGWQPAGAAKTAQIYRSGELVRELPLNRDRTLSVPGSVGKSRVVVRDRRARFAASPCRNKLCVHAGWLDRTGESATCLPNRVSLVLAGRGEPRFDTLNH